MSIVNDWQRVNYFKELVYQGDLVKLEDSSIVPRLYVLVRDDVLPPLHQGIQAAHACVLLASMFSVDPASYLILLGASSKQIVEVVRAAARANLGFASYVDTGLVDPEDGMAVLTACAFVPMSLEEGNVLFGHLKRAS